MPEVSESRLKASDVKPETSPAKVTWVSFKEVNPRTGKAMTTQMNLVNKAHPESRKAISIEANQKVLSNQQMGLLLALLKEKRFYKYARSGLTPERAPSGRGNGLITVRRGDQAAGLLFEKGSAGGGSPIPAVYVECKKIIIGIFNSADQPQVYTSDKDRVLEIDPRLPGGVKR